MKKHLIIILLISLISTSTFSQTKKIFIDTDCGFDDLSAITMFLSLPDVEIIGITSCGGNIGAIAGYDKIYELIKLTNDSLDNNFKISQILMGEDSKTGKIPAWRSFGESVIWGYCGQPTFEYFPKVSDKLPQILKETEEEIYYICLGPFTNLAKILKNNPELTSEIKKVYWYNGSLNLYGFNYEFDTKAADIVFSTDLQIDVISNLDNKSAKYDSEFLSVIKKSENIYTDLIIKNLENAENHNQTLWDELLPVYFQYPQVFDMLPDNKNPKISINNNYNIEEVKQAMLKIWNKDFSEEQNVVFENFPVEAEMFQFDVSEISDTVIKLYGLDEWKACILTNEFHRHLGIYSIVGVKMGIAALEYFDCKKDGLKVVSYAGLQPPISCLNDGLQMSTGATLGYGTISISADSTIIPEADFIYGTKKIHIKLKPQYIEQVEKDIKTGILTYGNLTDGYWKLIRSLGIKYWLEWNRNQIFEIEEVN